MGDLTKDSDCDYSPLAGKPGVGGRPEEHVSRCCKLVNRMRGRRWIVLQNAQDTFQVKN